MKKRKISVLVAVLMVFVLSLSSTHIAFAATVSRVYLCGIYHSDGGDRVTWESDTGKNFSKLQGVTIYKKNAFSSSNLANYLKSSDIFMINTHGNTKRLVAIDASGEESFLDYSDIKGWTSGSMSKADVVFLGGCYNGKGGINAENMVNILFQKGARCVIGFTGTVNSAVCGTMFKEFSYAISNGYSISSALTYADARVLQIYGKNSEVTSRLVRGDTSTTFTNHSVLLSLRDVTDNSLFGKDESSGIDLHAMFNIEQKGSILRTETIPVKEIRTILMSKGIDVKSYTLQEYSFDSLSGVTTCVFNNMHDMLETDDYVYIMVDSDRNILVCGQPHKGEYNGIEIDYERSLIDLQQIVNARDISEYDILNGRVVKLDNQLFVRYSVSWVNKDCYLEDFFYVPVENQE